MPQSIIVYRSQSEANADYFWNQMALPWVADHWLLVVGVLAAFVVGGIFYSVKNQR